MLRFNYLFWTYLLLYRWYQQTTTWGGEQRSASSTSSTSGLAITAFSANKYGRRRKTEQICQITMKYFHTSKDNKKESMTTIITQIAKNRLSNRMQRKTQWDVTEWRVMREKSATSARAARARMKRAHCLLPSTPSGHVYYSISLTIPPVSTSLGTISVYTYTYRHLQIFGKHVWNMSDLHS